MDTDTNITEETLSQAEEMLIEINVVDKSEKKHFNVFELRGEDLEVIREVIPVNKNQKWGTTILGAGLGALVVGRLVKPFLGNEGAILGTILGTLIGGMTASYILDAPSEEVIIEEKNHPVITVKEALDSLKSGKGFYITEIHRIESEDGAVYEITHWVKISNIEDLISFYNIETDKPPRNDFERIGQLLDKFDYRVLSEDGSVFYHAESSPFMDAKKILLGKGVNIRKYKQYKKEILTRDSYGNIVGFEHEDSGHVLITDKVSTEAELNYLLEHH